MLRALLLLVIGQTASLRLHGVRIESRRSVVGAAAAGLLLPLSLPMASSAMSDEDQDDFDDFRGEKKQAMEDQKEVSLASRPARLPMLTGGLRAAGYRKAGCYG